MTNRLLKLNALFVRLALVALICLLGYQELSAQPEWQWGKRWGGAFNNSNLIEEIDAMVVDHEGNVYISCNIAPGFFIGDSLHQNFGGSDNMLISFDCDGNVRWYHIFGNSYDNASTGWTKFSIAVDSQYLYYTLQVYRGNAGPFRFMDSMFVEANRVMIAKFDHNGNWLDYHWVWPGGTQSAWPFDMYTRNDTIWLLFASQAGTIQGQAVDLAYHVGVYDATNFNLIDLFTFGDPSAQHYPRRIIVDPSGNIIVGGWIHQPVNIGGQLWEGGMYLLKLDAQGQVVWIKGQEGPGWNSLISDIELKGHDIYISGMVANNVVIFGDTINVIGSSGSRPFLGKVDPNGNLLYYFASYNSTTAAISHAFTVVGDLVYLSAYTAGTHDYIFTQISSPGSTLIYTIIYDEISNTGTYISIPSTNSILGNQINAMTHDGNGNIYMAGKFATTIYPGNDTLNQTGGGIHDLFVAKYGVELCVDTTRTGIGILKNEKSMASAAIHPHPVRHSATLSLSLPPNTNINTLHLQVFDMQGRQAVVPAVQWQQGNGTVSGTLTRGALPQGLYLWRVVANGEALASGKVMFVD